MARSWFIYSGEKKRRAGESSHLRLSIPQVVVCETRSKKKNGTFKLIDFLLKACWIRIVDHITNTLACQNTKYFCLILSRVFFFLKDKKRGWKFTLFSSGKINSYFFPPLFFLKRTRRDLGDLLLFSLYRRQRTIAFNSTPFSQTLRLYTRELLNLALGRRTHTHTQMGKDFLKYLPVIFVWLTERWLLLMESCFICLKRGAAMAESSCWLSIGRLIPVSGGRGWDGRKSGSVAGCHT